MLVTHQFNLIDKFDRKYKIYAIDRDGNKLAEDWSFLLIELELAKLFSYARQDHLQLALQGFLEPLLSKIKYSPNECFERIAEKYKPCQLRSYCASFQPSCFDLKHLKCLLYESDFGQKEFGKKLAELFRFWQDGYYVFIIDP